MTEKQKERVAALLAAAGKCEEGGIRVGFLGKGAYRVLVVKDQRALECKDTAEIRAALDEGATLYVSDNERLWKEPRMVLELDIFAPEIVTRRYYFKGIKKTLSETAYFLLEDMLPEIVDPAEVVIYDHTRKINGRAAREVLT